LLQLSGCWWDLQWCLHGKPRREFDEEGREIADEWALSDFGIWRGDESSAEWKANRAPYVSTQAPELHQTDEKHLSMLMALLRELIKADYIGDEDHDDGFENLYQASFWEEDRAKGLLERIRARMWARQSCEWTLYKDESHELQAFCNSLLMKYAKRERSKRLKKDEQDQWEASFANLRAVALQQGSVPTKRPQRGQADVVAAIDFAEQQRSLHQKGRLEAVKVERFVEIPGWYWDLYDRKWDEQYENLKQVMANLEGRVPGKKERTVKGGDPATKLAASFAMNVLLGSI
jgi:hypothetical protein